MKSTVALLLPILGIMAQTKAPHAPMLRRLDSRAYTGVCRDIAHVKVDLTTDALTLGLLDFWPNSKTTLNPDDETGFGGYCGFELTVVPRSPGYRWRFKDVTLTGSAKAHGGASISHMSTQVWQDYAWWNDSNFTPGYARPVKTVRNFGGKPVEYTFYPSEMGPKNDYDATFSYTATTKDTIDYWSPCMPEDWDEFKDEFILTVVHSVYTWSKTELGDASYAELGKLGGKSDVVVRLNMEWEECDAERENFRYTWHNRTI